jgi:hypothetical protein
MGVIVFRIAMILSVLRRWEAEDKSEQVICLDNDFNIALALGDVYFRHSAIMMQLTPTSTAAPAQTIIDKFYSGLPPIKFPRSDAVQVGMKLGLSDHRVDRLLKHLLENNKLKRQEYGNYIKTQSQSVSDT